MRLTSNILKRGHQENGSSKNGSIYRNMMHTRHMSAGEGGRENITAS